jgi:nucleoside-diphosphate-sugar epimerase
MRILITGSSGQIGTNLGLRCLELKHEVVGVDWRDNDWTDCFRTHRANLCTMPAATIFGEEPWGWKPDVVVHLAAHAKVHQLVREPTKALENMVMTSTVLEYCRQAGASIILSSSREVYGNLNRLATEETAADFAFTESTYSASKIASEAMVYAYSRCYGLNYLVFRLSNVYGRYDNDIARMERVVPLFIDRIGRGDAVTVFGAEKVLDFTYIDDCIDGLLAGITLLQRGSLRNETINLGSGSGSTLLQLAQVIGDVVGRRPDVRLEPSRPGEISRYVTDLSHARRLLKFEPQVDLPEGVRRSLVWGVERSRPSTCGSPGER